MSVLIGFKAASSVTIDVCVFNIYFGYAFSKLKKQNKIEMLRLKLQGRNPACRERRHLNSFQLQIATLELFLPLPGKTDERLISLPVGVISAWRMQFWMGKYEARRTV